MVLDFHTHIYPDDLAPRVIRNLTSAEGVYSYSGATAAALRESMARAGIDCAVLCNIATKPGQAGTITRFAAEFLGDGGQGPRLIPFASVHPLEEGWREWLCKVKAMGFAGVKLHPDYQGFYVDDHRLEPFYRETARLGLIVVLHAGKDLSMPGDCHATAERIAEVLPLLELGTTVLAHMGGHEMYERTLALTCGRDVYLDTSYSLRHIPTELVRAMIRKHSPQRILFGTDSPWCDQADSLRYLRGQLAPGFLSDADLHGILWGNGAALLGLSAPRSDTGRYA